MHWWHIHILIAAFQFKSVLRSSDIPRNISSPLLVGIRYLDFFFLVGKGNNWVHYIHRERLGSHGCFYGNKMVAVVWHST